MSWFQQHRAKCPLAHLAGSPAITIVLLVCAAFGLTALAPNLASVHLPGNQIGYEPTQPIAFSHRLHAGELQVQCLYCHSGAERSRHAGIPAANVCMNCHRFVTAPFGAVRAEDELAKKEKREPRRIVTPEIQKLYDAVGFNPANSRAPIVERRPIAWVKIHSLPDFAYFDHRPHVNGGVNCQTCHGPVETMERMRQVPDLSMGWCVNCHRDATKSGVAGKPVHASTDCSTCHY